MKRTKAALASLKAEEEDEFFSKNVQTFWGMAIRRFVKNRMAVLGLLVLLVFIFLCFILPLFMPFDPYEIHFAERYQKPSELHRWGTDGLGRDIFYRYMLGGRTTMTVGFLSAIVALAIGIPLGCLAGYYGGIVDAVIMRLVEFFSCIPTLPVLMVFSTLLARGNIWLMIAIIGLFSWPNVCRQVRAQYLTLKTREFVEAARALGFKDKRIIFKHILPHAVTPAVIMLSSLVIDGILYEAALSYLGMGVRSPLPSWGKMLGRGAYMMMYVSLAVYYIGDGIRGALDPKETPVRLIDRIAGFVKKAIAFFKKHFRKTKNA